MNMQEYLIKLTKAKKNWRGSKTHGRGTKGQKARKSGHVRPGFEGGQTPVYRRVPKLGGGFRPKKFVYRLINLEKLEADKHIIAGQTLDFTSEKSPVKILGRGKLTKKLTVLAAAFSQTAQEKIAQVGGEVKVVSKIK